MKTYTIILLALATAGCTQMEKTDPDGSGWKYRSVFNRKIISELSVSKDGGIKMKGYQSTQAENLNAVAEGVAKGLGKAVVP